MYPCVPSPNLAHFPTKSEGDRLREMSDIFIAHVNGYRKVPERQQKERQKNSPSKLQGQFLTMQVHKTKNNKIALSHPWLSNTLS